MTDDEAERLLTIGERVAAALERVLTIGERVATALERIAEAQTRRASPLHGARLDGSAG
jgi:hypothetical protein